MNTSTLEVDEMSWMLMRLEMDLYISHQMVCSQTANFEKRISIKMIVLTGSHETHETLKDCEGYFGDAAGTRLRGEGNED